MRLSHNYFIVFGAAVKPDGSPSGTLKRRVDGALLSAKDRGSARFLVTGGVGDHGPAEAQVMKNILVEAGVPEANVIMECQGHDTLSSVLFCTQILQNCMNVASVTVCSSTYHIPRCRMLFALTGIKSIPGKRLSDRPALGFAKWLYYWFRECVAFPYDFILLVGMIAAGKVTGKG